MITREQFTRWDSYHHPEIDNKDFLQYEKVVYGSSFTILSYGYKETIGTKYTWLKLSAVPEYLKVLDNDLTI